MGKMEAIDCWPAFLARDKQELFFVRFNAPDSLRVNKRVSKSGEVSEFFHNINVLDVDSGSLKSLGVWDSLTQDIRDTVVKLDNGDEIDKVNKMEHARKYRRNKYPGVPNTLTCVNCNVEQKMSPGLIVKNAEKMAKEKGILYTPADYVAKFVCSKCNPKRRGRAPSHNLPPKVELVCKCGKKVIYPASVALKFAEKKGLKVEEYIKGYVCQVCHPTKGRHKK